MAVKTVQTVINGQTYTLTLNSSTGEIRGYNYSSVKIQL